MIALDYYNYFYKVAILGNITRAAKELYISQPALSKAIQKLETILECKLFERSTKGVTLTAEGELFLQHVKQTYKQFNETKIKIDGLRSTCTSVLRIGVGADICECFLLPEMKDFQKRHRDTLINVVVMPSNAMGEALKEQTVDMTISTEPLSDEFTFARKLFPLYDCFIVGPQYKHLVDSGPISIFEIINYPLIMLNKDTRTRRSFERAILNTYGVVVPPVHEIADTQLISKFVQQGWGIGCVTENFVQSDLDAEKIFKLRLVEELPHRYATLTWNIEAHSSVFAKDLISQLEHAGERMMQHDIRR